MVSHHLAFIEFRNPCRSLVHVAALQLACSGIYVPGLSYRMLSHLYARLSVIVKFPFSSIIIDFAVENISLWLLQHWSIIPIATFATLSDCHSLSDCLQEASASHLCRPLCGGPRLLSVSVAPVWWCYRHSSIPLSLRGYFAWLVFSPVRYIFVLVLSVCWNSFGRVRLNDISLLAASASR